MGLIMYLYNLTVCMEEHDDISWLIHTKEYTNKEFQSHVIAVLHKLSNDNDQYEFEWLNGDFFSHQVVDGLVKEFGYETIKPAGELCVLDNGPFDHNLDDI